MKEVEPLDSAVEETMDASDPVSIEVKEPVPSSSFPEEKKSWLNRIKDKLFQK
jgi:hypothetical protein